MITPRRTAQIDQLGAAIRDKNSEAAGSVIEEIAATDPATAQRLIDGLIELGQNRE